MKIDIGLPGKGSKPLSATTQLVNSAINAEKIKKEVGFENYDAISIALKRLT